MACWNFLQCSREHNVKFDPDKWTDPTSGGLYITYTLARIRKASGLQPTTWGDHALMATEMTQADADLAGYGEYFNYYVHKAALANDPAPLANFAHDLARKLGTAYHTEKIVGGRPGFLFAIRSAVMCLSATMHRLRMFVLRDV